LVAVFWILNWSLSGLRTHWGFFPLWLGYALTVDALVFLTISEKNLFPAEGSLWKAVLKSSIIGTGYP